jgi:hypothetical protein
MPVVNPRNRLVYFRLSEDEYSELSDICQQRGARSMSELARSAVMRMSNGMPEDDTARHALFRAISQLTERVNELTQLLRVPRGSV